MRKDEAFEALLLGHYGGDDDHWWLDANFTAAQKEQWWRANCCSGVEGFCNPTAATTTGGATKGGSASNGGGDLPWRSDGGGVTSWARGRRNREGEGNKEEGESENVKREKGGGFNLKGYDDGSKEPSSYVDI